MDMGFWREPRAGWWSMHRHGHGRRRLRRGVLKFVLLKLLADMPRHGYELIRTFREKGWGAGAGSVYPLLAGLEAAGLIVGRDEGDRRIYDISEKGRGHLEEHAAELRHFFEDDDEVEAESVPGEQLRESAGRLMQASAQLEISAKPETVERVRELLDGVRKEIYALLAAE
jgi:DNA-binding PadR family transcriptional regulator